MPSAKLIFISFAFAVLGLLAEATGALPAAPEELVGTWGMFDPKSGQCAPDAAGVTLTEATLTAEAGGHGIEVPLDGEPSCLVIQCIVTTHSAGRARYWFWTFQNVDVATIQGLMPHPMATAADGLVPFDFTLKRGCP